ncbi:hypothetical protein GF319_04540, partial [Candidatus Bathyarchaeota archaeon]|nr:hypothetical protein [Candidatus Bathyarchaeota archaeon]
MIGGMSMKRLGIFLLLILSLNTFAFTFAQERDVSLSTPFPTIEFVSGQRIRFKITVTNLGSQVETLNIYTEAPNNWEIQTKSDLYIIKQVHLGIDESRTFDLEANPPQGEESGNYSILIRVTSADGLVSKLLNLGVELPSTATDSGLSLIASYPSLEGSVGEDYEFRMNVINLANKDVVVYFTAEHPENWDVNFKPRFGSSVVRSLEFASGENDVVVIDVSPPPDVEPGSYEIKVFAQTEEETQSLTFSIYIVGSYLLDFKPSNNRVSLKAKQGESNIIALNVTNSGSAPLENVIMFSEKPSGWDVDFESEEISSLQSGESRQIRANIVPPKDSIPGDYIVTLYSAVQSRGISKTLNYRVTVTGSTSWGFIG